MQVGRLGGDIMELVEFAHLAELIYMLITGPPMVVHEKWAKGQEYMSQF